MELSADKSFRRMITVYFLTDDLEELKELSDIAVTKLPFPRLLITCICKKKKTGIKHMLNPILNQQ